MKKSCIFLGLFFVSCIKGVTVTHPLLITSIPKAGTNLIDRVVTEITEQRVAYCASLTALDQSEINALGQTSFYEAHAPCSLNNYNLVQQNKLKVIVMIRDPRDVLVSYAHWLKKGLGHQLEPNWPELQDLPIDQVIMNFIEHYPTKGPEIAPYTSLAEFYDLFSFLEQL